MTDFNIEIEKAKEYEKFNYEHISFYMYQTFGVIIVSTFSYKHINEQFQLNFTQNHLLFFIMAVFAIYYSFLRRQFNEKDKSQKKIIFENINLYNFLQFCASQKIYPNLYEKNVSQIYLAITGMIMKSAIQNQSQDVVEKIYEQVKNKTLQMKSYEVISHINNLK